MWHERTFLNFFGGVWPVLLYSRSDNCYVVMVLRAPNHTVLDDAGAEQDFQCFQDDYFDGIRNLRKNNQQYLYTGFLMGITHLRPYFCGCRPLIWDCLIVLASFYMEWILTK